MLSLSQETNASTVKLILSMKIATFLIMIFPALLKDEVSSDLEQEDLFKINPERGIN